MTSTTSTNTYSLTKRENLLAELKYDFLYGSGTFDKWNVLISEFEQLMLENDALKDRIRSLESQTLRDSKL